MINVITPYVRTFSIHYAMELKHCCIAKAKCFADDLTIISSLTSLVPKAGDI